MFVFQSKDLDWNNSHKYRSRADCIVCNSYKIIIEYFISVVKTDDETIIFLKSFVSGKKSLVQFNLKLDHKFNFPYVGHDC